MLGKGRHPSRGVWGSEPQGVLGTSPGEQAMLQWPEHLVLGSLFTCKSQETGAKRLHSHPSAGMEEPMASLLFLPLAFDSDIH